MNIFDFFKSKPAAKRFNPTPNRWTPQDAGKIRKANESNERMFRAYDAATTTNLNIDFNPTFGSANAEILTSLYIARGRARTLVKDDPIAKGLLRVLRNNIGGENPFRLEMKCGSWSADGKTFTTDLNLNRMIEKEWKRAGRAENCTVRKDMDRTELYLSIISAVIRDGSVLVRHHRAYPGNKYFYGIELIESDRLQESYMGKGINGNAVRFSIERDMYNAPVAYYILTRHPGDLFQYNNTTQANVWRERVDASEIIHINNIRDRAEQDIGFPEFDAIIQPLHQNRQFDRAHVASATWAMCKPWFITQEFPGAGTYDGDPTLLNAYNGSAGSTAGNNSGDSLGTGADRIDVASPGSGQVLGYGQKPMLVDPKFPVESADSFQKNNLKRVSSGAGVAYTSISNDYDGYSFSSARAAQIPERDNFKVYQKLIIDNFVRPHFGEWLKHAIMTKVIDVPFTKYDEIFEAAHFHSKRWPSLNPVQDAQADITKIGAGLESPQQVLADSEHSTSLEELYAQLAASKQMAEAHGLTFVMPAPGGGMMPQDTGQAKSEAKKEGE